LSRNRTPVGRQHALLRDRGGSQISRWADPSGPIRPVTERRSLFPTSSFRPSLSLPYGWPARRRAGRSDGVSTFRMTALIWTT